MTTPAGNEQSPRMTRSSTARNGDPKIIANAPGASPTPRPATRPPAAAAAVGLARLAHRQIDADGVSQIERVLDRFAGCRPAAEAHRRKRQPRQANAEPAARHGPWPTGCRSTDSLGVAVGQDDRAIAEPPAEVQEQLAQFQQLDFVEIGQGHLPVCGAHNGLLLTFGGRVGGDIAVDSRPRRRACRRWPAE